MLPAELAQSSQCQACPYLRLYSRVNAAHPGAVQMSLAEPLTSLPRCSRREYQAWPGWQDQRTSPCRLHSRGLLGLIRSCVDLSTQTRRPLILGARLLRMSRVSPKKWDQGRWWSVTQLRACCS